MIDIHRKKNKSMLYTHLTKLAMITAYEAYKSQKDKSGVPYIFHPIHVAYKMVTEDEICVALLHDVVEDTDVTLDDLRAKGFPEHIIDSIKLLTKKKSNSEDKDVLYIEYIGYINALKTSGNDVAIKVKLADLRHNCDQSRIYEQSLTKEDIEWFYERFKMYEEAISKLEDK